MGKNIALVIITVGVTIAGVKLTALYGPFGYLPTGILAMLGIYIRGRVLDHLEEREEKRKYAARVWGFIEHTRFPGDDEELVRAQYHRDWLGKVENDLDVPVDTIIFQEDRPNEQWEDYLVRLGDETAKLKEKRDRDLQKAVHSERVSRVHGKLTREWYYRVALKKKMPERPKSDLEMEIIT